MPTTLAAPEGFQDRSVALAHIVERFHRFFVATEMRERVGQLRPATADPFDVRAVVPARADQQDPPGPGGEAADKIARRAARACVVDACVMHPFHLGDIGDHRDHGFALVGSPCAAHCVPPRCRAW